MLLSLRHSRFSELNRIKQLFRVPRGVEPETFSLTRRALREYIGDGSAVVVLVENSALLKAHGSIWGQGFFTRTENLSMVDSYANTNDVDRMIDDQLEKMALAKGIPDPKYFLLSWTLTPKFTDLTRTIEDLARSANSCLLSRLIPKCNTATYPNIVLTDYVPDHATEVAMLVNELASKR